MAGPSFYHPDQAVFLREPHAIRLHPLGGGADDSPQLQAALDTGKEVVPAAGTYELHTPVFPRSNSLLSCLPGVHFVSTCNPATEFPFSLIYLLSGAGNTTLAAANTVGSRTISTVATVPIGTIIMIHDVTGGAWRRNFYHTTNVAGGGPFTVTLDRPCNFSFDVGDEVQPCTYIAENVHLHFNGADITGTGVRAIYATGAQHCTYHDLHVIGTGWTHSGISWDEGDYDCHSYRCSVESDGTTYAGGGALTCESSEQCSHESPIVNNVAGVGILAPDNVDCWVSDVKIEGCSTGIWVYATDAAKGSANFRVEGGTIVAPSSNGVQVRVASKHTTVRNVHVRAARAVGFLADGASDDTLFEKCSGDGAATSVFQIASATRTRLRCVTTDNAAGGIITDSSIDIRGWLSTGCGYELSMTTGTVRVRDFEMTGASLGGGFHVRNYGTGTLDMADGFCTVPNADYCIRSNSTGVVKIRNIVLTAPNGIAAYLDTAANTFYDLGGCTYSGAAVTPLYITSTFPKAWKEGEAAAPVVTLAGGATAAQLNWGTFVSDTVPNQVTVPNAWITGATDRKKILLGLGTLGGVPCPIVESAARAAGNFYMTAHVAGNTTTYTYRLAE